MRRRSPHYRPHGTPIKARSEKTKYRQYLQTVTDFPFTQLKNSELKRQLETLENQSAIYEPIQDRIVELLEEKDSGGHLEEEEQEE